MDQRKRTLQASSPWRRPSGSSPVSCRCLGLLRWVYVVPALARAYANPTLGPEQREAHAAVFRALHQYLGVGVGEHLGYLFTGIWSVLIGVGVIQGTALPTWLGKERARFSESSSPTRFANGGWTGSSVGGSGGAPDRYDNEAGAWTSRGTHLPRRTLPGTTTWGRIGWTRTSCS